MSFEQEWAQHRAAAADNQSTHMQLNQLPASPGGSGADGDLTVHDDELGKLGNMAHDLRAQLSTAADHPRPATFDASVELSNDGLDMGSALTALHDAWNTQLATLKEACAHISNHLDFTRAAHKNDEAKIVTEMKNAGGETMTVSRINDLLN
jgi:hypothetical protein